jgi:hypothetical protein
LSIKDFLLDALLDDVGILGIGTKLAAIEAIGRVFPSSSRINYQMAGRAPHIGLLFFRFITLGSVVSSCCAHDRLREIRPTTTLKRAAGAEERLSAGSLANGTIQPQDRCLVQFVKHEMGIHIMGRGLLLWLLGIPLPIILLVWLLGGLHG